MAGLRLEQGTEREAATSTMCTPEALAFVTRLVERLAPAREELLQARQEAQARYDGGELPTFRDDTAWIRKGAWKCAPLPAELTDRRVEITGPPDRKMMINALNSGANVFMADLEDSMSPTWANVVQGLQNLHDAVRNELHFVHPKTGKEYVVGANPARLMVRPRGLHLVERNVTLDGKPVPATIFDVGMFLFHNARALVDHGTRPYLYLPKMEAFEEALWFDELFLEAQHALGLPVGTVRATVLIETLPAAFQMDEILFALRHHAVGLNCGRWDYIFSLIKVTRAHADRVLPDRSAVGMQQPFMRAYTQREVAVCHRRGVFAMGGMAAQIPIKHDEEAHAAAMAKVRADKEREVRDGHDGTWVAHPALVPVAQAAFNDVLQGQTNQLEVQIEAHEDAAALLATPLGPRTRAGLSHSVEVGIQYLAAWLAGQGCVPLHHLMEDAATAEICRAQIWQWVRHGATLDDGAVIDADLVSRLAQQVRENAEHPLPTIRTATDLFVRLCTAEVLAPFLTTEAYAIARPLETA
ncbi:MAG: malate synthase A [Myxococcota bacterium]